MQPHTPTRRVEQPLRVKLFTRSYDTLQFRADKRILCYPGTDKVTSAFLDLTQILENEPTTAASPPIHFRIIRCETDPFMTPGSHRLYVPGTRIHSLHQLGVPFRDSYTGMNATRDIARAKATWLIDHDHSGAKRKVIHREGLMETYQEETAFQIPPRSRYIGDFLKCLSKNGDEADDPFAPLNYMLSLPKPEGLGSVMLMMEICGKNTQVLIMDVKAPDDSFALKFTLTLPVGDTHAPGTLEVRSRGLNYPVAEFPHLGGMLLALWLVHSGQELTYFET